MDMRPREKGTFVLKLFGMAIFCFFPWRINVILSLKGEVIRVLNSSTDAHGRRKCVEQLRWRCFHHDTMTLLGSLCLLAIIRTTPSLSILNFSSVATSSQSLCDCSCSLVCFSRSFVLLPWNPLIVRSLFHSFVRSFDYAFDGRSLVLLHLTILRPFVRSFIRSFDQP